MHRYSQTNVQLINQLRSEGYSQPDIEFVWKTYQFAVQLFAGLYLPSGKPFIDHFVGTASILTSLRLPVEVVVAGLIHAAYRYGDFGEARSGVSQSKRKQVVDIVGGEIEAYVARYENRNWNLQNLAILYDGLDDLSSLDRNVILIRMASELERCLDLGELYFPDTQQRRAAQQKFIETGAPLWVKMAGRLGFASFSAEMKTVFEEMAASKGLVGPRVQTQQQGAFLVRPESLSERLGVGIRRRLYRGYWLASRIPNRAKRFCKRGLGAWIGSETR
jgi:(p)ppGpp synthase/HD superfamily hydrolase